MVSREEKIRQIVHFVKEYPGSLASRTVMRRLHGGDYELNDRHYHNLEETLQDSEFKEVEIDSCYDLIRRKV